jgi:hypothetical protein
MASMGYGVVAKPVGGQNGVLASAAAVRGHESSAARRDIPGGLLVVETADAGHPFNRDIFQTIVQV